MTPEQKAYAIINVLQIGALAALFWWWMVDELFEWMTTSKPPPANSSLDLPDKHDA